MIRYKPVLIATLFLISIATYVEDLGKHMPTLLYLSTVSAISFWSAIALLIPTSFYKSILPDSRKSKAYWISFSIYSAFHIIAYGIFYAMILGYIGFFPYFSYGVGAAVTPPWPYFISWEATSPGYWFFIGGYESDGTPFATFMGVLLALTIAANIERLSNMYKVLKSTRVLPTNIIVIPSIGIFSGTSCCLSLPTVLIYMTALSIGVVNSILAFLASPVYFSLVYYGLPIMSIVLLYLNLKVIIKITSKCRRKTF